MMKIPVTLDADGIATVNHDLATTDVTVTCLDGDTPVGYVGAFPIDSHSVEVVTVPGTTVTHVLVESGT
jgi:hypothetical protein